VLAIVHLRDGLSQPWTCPSRATSGPSREARSWPGRRRRWRKSFRPAPSRRQHLDQIPVHVRNAVMAAEDRDSLQSRLLVLSFRSVVQETTSSAATYRADESTDTRCRDAGMYKKERRGQELDRASGWVRRRKAKELVISTKSQANGPTTSAAVVSEHHLFRRGVRHRRGHPARYYRQPRRTVDRCGGALLDSAA